MAAAKLKLPAIEKGATYRHRLLWKNTAGQPTDLTDCTAKMQIREEVGSSNVLLELSTENGRITITPKSGELDFYIAAEDTALLTTEGGVYALEVYFLNSDTWRLCEGSILFTDEVTR